MVETEQKNKKNWNRKYKRTSFVDHIPNQQFYVLLINVRSSLLRSDWCLICRWFQNWMPGMCYSPLSFFLYLFLSFSVSKFSQFYFLISIFVFECDAQTFSQWQHFTNLKLTAVQLFIILCVCMCVCISGVLYLFSFQMLTLLPLLQLNQWQITYEMYVCFLELCALFISKWKKKKTTTTKHQPKMRIVLNHNLILLDEIETLLLGPISIMYGKYGRAYVTKHSSYGFLSQPFSKCW